MRREQTQRATVARLKRLENSVAFLSNVKEDLSLELRVVNEDNTVDVENTRLLQELRELNSRREELLNSLTA